MPLRLDPSTARKGGGPVLDVVARLKDGVDLARARAEMTAISRALAAEQPGVYGNFVAQVQRYRRPSHRRMFRDPHRFR
ncbi:MAG TPA: hypothetical protein VHQ90_00875 [Thermoanaerobaculia bacterium]|nr:hypothetical protein [Thermoanaerobaculia bacterium]